MPDGGRSSVKRVCVFQSYRTTNVPAWMTKCLDSVASWASAQGFEYRFIGDEFFDCVPEWYRDACQGHKWPLSDLARLITARTILAEGFDRVLWFDADLIIFQPDSLSIDLEPEFGFCREPWLWHLENPLKAWILGRGPAKKLLSRDSWRGYFTAEKVNNACFCVGRNRLLDLYIDAVLHAGRQLDTLPKEHMGPIMLTALHQALRFPLIRNIGAFSNAVIDGLSTGRARIPRAYVRFAGEPLYAANLCASSEIDENHYMGVVELLLESGGGVINKHF